MTTTLTSEDLYQRVKHVVPAVEWATMAEDAEAILRLKRERNAVILAHNYMTPEIFHAVADITGDSLALAREATDVDADVIVLAGVHFMAETAKLLNPSKTVLIPDLRSGCSLAESITADDVRASTTAIERRIHPEDLPAYRASQQQAAAALTRWHLEFRVCLPLQGVRWRQGDASPSRDPDNGVVWHGFVTDITDRKRAELELRELAATDALTNLPNRRHFMSRIAAELTRLQRHGGQGSAVLMCDLDHFKRINDTWGHAIGDGVLQHFASMLRAQLREIDLVGRIGGEEFAVVLPDTSIESAHLFARDVQHRIADTPYLSDGLQVPLTVSIGISALHAKDDHAELALSRSDRALYYAKQRGRNRIESVFSR